MTFREDLLESHENEEKFSKNYAQRNIGHAATGERSRRGYVNGFEDIKLAENPLNREIRNYVVRNINEQPHPSTELKFSKHETLPPPQASPIDYSRPAPNLIRGDVGGVEEEKLDKLPTSFLHQNKNLIREFDSRDSRILKTPTRRRHSSPISENRAAKCSRFTPPDRSIAAHKNSPRISENMREETALYLKNIYAANRRIFQRQDKGVFDSNSQKTDQGNSRHYFEDRQTIRSNSETVPETPQCVYPNALSPSQEKEKAIFEAAKYPSVSGSASLSNLTTEALSPLYSWILSRYLNKLAPESPPVVAASQTSPFVFLPLPQKLTPAQQLFYYQMTSSYEPPSHLTAPTSESFSMPQTVTTSTCGTTSPHSRSFSSSSPDSGCAEVTESEADSSQQCSDQNQEKENHDEVTKT